MDRLKNGHIGHIMSSASTDQTGLNYKGHRRRGSDKWLTGGAKKKGHFAV